MVYFVRFFKPPRPTFSRAKDEPQISLSAVITVQNDLGDLFLQTPVELSAQLLRLEELEEDQNVEVVDTQRRFHWPGKGTQSINIGLPLYPEGDDYKLCVSEYLGNGTRSQSPIIPRIIPAWSAPVGSSPSVAEALAERRFTLPLAVSGEKSKQEGDHLEVRICEETGNSIACHIWDAALGFILLFHRLLDGSRSKKKKPFLPALHAHLTQPQALSTPGQAPRVIELGSGPGLVGISLSKVFPSIGPTLLTDLDEAQDLLQRNVSFNRPTPISSSLPASLVSHTILPWGTITPQDTGPSDYSQVRLIVASECTYNPASYSSLIHTFTSIIRQSRAARVLVLVGMKRRHDSEEGFFALMSEEGFRMVEREMLELPGVGDEDMDKAMVEFYVFEMEKKG